MQKVLCLFKNISVSTRLSFFMKSGNLSMIFFAVWFFKIRFYRLLKWSKFAYYTSLTQVFNFVKVQGHLEIILGLLWGHHRVKQPKLHQNLKKWGVKTLFLRGVEVVIFGLPEDYADIKIKAEKHSGPKLLAIKV